MSTTSVARHPTDDALELYALGRLFEADLEVLEIHLLVCSECQERCVEVDKYVAVMKDVCRQTPALPIKLPRPAFVTNPLRLPAPVWAGALAAGLMVLALPLLNHSTTAPTGGETELNLVASRGGESVETAGGPLRLKIDTADLAPFPSYVITVVSASGAQIISSTVTPQGRHLTLRIPQAPASGSYWVRVNGPEGQPVREFSLRLK